MKVWENLKKLWKYSPVARVLTAFLALPNFYSCFYDNSIEIRYMLSISWIKKDDTTIDFIIHTSNFQFSAVDHYIDRCRRFVNTLDFKRSLTRRFANLSQAERLALRNLRRRTDVVIKPADKGGLLSFGHALFTSKRLKNSCLSKDSTKNSALIRYKIINGKWSPRLMKWLLRAHYHPQPRISSSPHRTIPFLPSTEDT